MVNLKFKSKIPFWQITSNSLKSSQYIDKRGHKLILFIGTDRVIYVE